MNRLVAAVVAIIVLLLAGPLTGAALAAADARAQQPVPGGDSGPDDSGPLRLTLDELTPRVVTADGPTVLTVTGVLRNTGTEPVAELGVRLQRGAPLTSEGRVRDALEGAAPTDAIVPQFQELGRAGEIAVLRPGAEVPVRLTVPLRGAAESTLALTGTGVYELLVNVNGVPEGGDRARLAAVRMLLPVLGLPAGADGSAPVTGEARSPTPFALLYPITDAPRRLSTVPGEPVLLADDTLADSFTAEGRLGGLVSALAGTTPTARAATCVAVDPDLVQTAEAMAGGYQVITADGTLVPGRGAEAAAAWLDGLRAAVAGGCVLPLPFADADLVSLTRGGLAGPAVEAVTAGAAITAGVLQTPVLDATVWPAGGVVDEPTLAALAGGGTSTVLLSADGVGTSEPSGVVPLATPTAGPSPTAVLADPLLTLAAGGVPDADAGTGTVGATTAPAGAPGALGTQDLLGTVAFRATEDPPAGAPLVLAPPRGWDTGGPAARALLDGVDRFVTAGLLTSRGLGEVVAAGAPPGADAAALEYPLAAGSREIPASTVVSIDTVLADVADLRSSVVEDAQGIGSDDAFDPLLRGALRPASAALRGEPGRSADSAAAGVRRIADLRGTVTVLEPPSPFSLGSSNSPLLLTVANGLPVTMNVRVELASTSGLRVAPIPAVEIPPLGRRQIQANAEVLRSGVFTVDAAVRTQDGGLLGPPSRLQVRSTAYGTITLWLTGTAGVLLVVLAGRRILRRVRAEPVRHPDGPAPEPAPEPTATPDDLQVRTAPGRTRTGPPTVRRPGTDGTAPGGPSSPREAPTVPVRTVPPPNVPPNAPNRPGPRTGPNPPAPSVPVSAAGPAPRPVGDRSHPSTGPPAPRGPGEVRRTGGPHPRPWHPPDRPGPPPESR